MLNNTLTNEMMLDIINNKYKFAITRDSILTSLNNRVESLNSALIVWIILILFAIIIAYVRRNKKHSMIMLLGIILFLGINAYDCLCERNNIIYSIKNNCWSIEKDKVIDKEIYYRRAKRETFIRYYIKTNTYGKIQVSRFEYENIEKYSEVYVICAQYKSGKKFPIDFEVSPADVTYFVESLNIFNTDVTKNKSN